MSLPDNLPEYPGANDGTPKMLFPILKVRHTGVGYNIDIHSIDDWRQLPDDWFTVPVRAVVAATMMDCRMIGFHNAKTFLLHVG